ALPKRFAWLHERIASPDVVRTALGGAVAIAGTGSLDAPAPKGCRRITDGVAIFIAPDDATALAAATTLRAGAVIAPSGLLVLPGLARIVDPRQRAERDATTQLAAMAARLHEELITAERAQRDVLAQRVEEARLQSATMEERRSASVRVRDALSEQVSATERRIAEEETRLRALVAQERDSRGRLEAAQHDLGRAAADAKEAARSAELA